MLAAPFATSRCIALTDATRPDLPLVYVNPAFSDLTGYALDDLIGLNCRFLQGPDTDPGMIAEMHRCIGEARPFHGEILNYRKDGSSFWNELTIDPILSQSGSLIGFIGVLTDTTARRAALQSLLDTEQLLSSVVANLPGYLFQRVLRPDGSFAMTYMSPSAYRLLDVPADYNWSAENGTGHMHPDDRAAYLQAVFASSRTMLPLRAEFRVVNRDGQPRWYRTEACPRRLADGSVVWDGLALDVTTEKFSTDRLAFLTTHDALTGLLNRDSFKLSLAQALVDPSGTPGRAGLFHLNIAAFREVNQTRGEVFADKVLRRVALIMTEFAEAHGGTACRLGGDEFALLLPMADAGCSGLQLAEWIGHEVARPMVIDRQEIRLEACVGGAILEGGAAAPGSSAQTAWDDLMKQAHIALQAARQSGAGHFCLYSPAIDDSYTSAASLRRSLKRAIEETQFALHYQPMFDLHTGQIVGAEALLRWNHPELGLQRPDQFIPVAERSGLILPLGAWVVKEAMRQAQEWRKTYGHAPSVAINVSGIQLQRGGFVETVRDALRETGANPADFEFELTEGVLIEVSAEMQDQLNQLRTLGFTLAIDDFGTGHSSFQYLRQFAVDKIKIDQTFVRQFVANSNDENIIRAMITLARSLNLATVAEGIETVRQRDFLRDEGCRIGQGYLFSKPLSGADFGLLLAK